MYVSFVCIMRLLSVMVVGGVRLTQSGLPELVITLRQRSIYSTFIQDASASEPYILSLNVYDALVRPVCQAVRDNHSRMRSPETPI
jgi:hypothetical protein